MYAFALFSMPISRVSQKLTQTLSQIAQSLRTFGITPTTTNLLAIKLSTDTSITSSTISEHLSASIQGIQVEFNDTKLAGLNNIAKIRKLYKLGGVGEEGSKGKRRRKDGTVESSGLVDGTAAKDAERERRELEVAILGLMALRGAV